MENIFLMVLVRQRLIVVISENGQMLHQYVQSKNIIYNVILLILFTIMAFRHPLKRSANDGSNTPLDCILNEIDAFGGVNVKKRDKVKRGISLFIFCINCTGWHNLLYYLYFIYNFLNF